MMKMAGQLLSHEKNIWKAYIYTEYGLKIQDLSFLGQYCYLMKYVYIVLRTSLKSISICLSLHQWRQFERYLPHPKPPIFLLLEKLTPVPPVSSPHR